jgi:hypothetical protein
LPEPLGNLRSSGRATAIRLYADSAPFFTGSRAVNVIAEEKQVIATKSDVDALSDYDKAKTYVLS